MTTLAQPATGGKPIDPQRPYASNAVLEVRNLRKHFIKRPLFPWQQGTTIRAVDGVDLLVERGKTLGLVGESGCGKTTTGRTIVKLEEPTTGQILVDGLDIVRGDRATIHQYRRKVQMIFQDPYASLDPRMKVRELISEPLTIQHSGSRAERRERALALQERVGLGRQFAEVFPSQLSGGQRQRVGIARALALDPALIVADEPTSALDVSVRAQVINLLRELQASLNLSFVFISHDLATVRYVSDRVAVMYLGRIVESAPADELFAHPMHPYTQALISAVPVPDPAQESARSVIILAGEPPNPANPPAGCRFSSRCPLVTDLCRQVEPELIDYGADRTAACHYVT